MDFTAPMALCFFCMTQTTATEITVHNPYMTGSQKIDGRHLFCAEGELASCELHEESILTGTE